MVNLLHRRNFRKVESRKKYIPLLSAQNHPQFFFFTKRSPLFLRSWLCLKHENWVPSLPHTHDTLNHRCHTRVSNSFPLFSSQRGRERENAKIEINFERKIFTQNVITYWLVSKLRKLWNWAAGGSFVWKQEVRWWYEEF